MPQKEYSPDMFGQKEAQMMRDFSLQKDDAVLYFTQCIRPRLDRSYKLYISDNGDRAKQIKPWQANVFVPYINAVVETLMPRILDARPEFTAQGRTEEDQLRTTKVQQLTDYTWEVAKGDSVMEEVTRSALIYGTGFMQTSWKVDKRKLKFLSTKDLAKDKLKWKEEEKTFYDAPFVESVDNYALMYDWHNIEGKKKQYWFKRLLLTWDEIERKYPGGDPKRMKMAKLKPGGDLEDYASIRNDVKQTHDQVVKGADAHRGGGGDIGANRYETYSDTNLQMYEVFEWWQPYKDFYSVVVNEVPILKGGWMPNPYDFKEAPFTAVQYLKLPGEFEGYGIPMLLENPQLMLNMIKNQRLDAASLNIHKMWIVNPLANVNTSELVTRPFGIIYSNDPGGVREVAFTDVKASAYREEEMLKGDMRYASGVDDFSMGSGGGASSATEVRHLRESTLERVRLFVNHLGDGLSDVMRYWFSMYRQFYTDEMIIRIVGDDGKTTFPLIEKDDLMGEYDFKAAVIPSIAGQQDVKRKQDMDLFQLLINLPFVDPQKLTSKVLFDWNWNIDSITKSEEAPQEGEAPLGPDGQPMQGPEGMPPMAPGGEAPAQMDLGGGDPLSKLQGTREGAFMPSSPSPFNELTSPVNLLGGKSLPPTAPGVPKAAGGGMNEGSNPRGLNRGGKVNTNVATNKRSSEESNILNRTYNLQ